MTAPTGTRTPEEVRAGQRRAGRGIVATIVCGLTVCGVGTVVLSHIVGDGQADVARPYVTDLETG